MTDLDEMNLDATDLSFEQLKKIMKWHNAVLKKSYISRAEVREAIGEFDQYGSNYEFTPKLTQRYIKEKIGETTGRNQLRSELLKRLGL